MFGNARTILVSVVMHATVFALTFALAGAGVVAFLASLGPEPAPKERFLNDLIVWIFVLQSAFNAAIAGLIAGALYGLVPRPARDVWLAMAFGAGAAFVPLNLIVGLALPPTWVLGLATAGAVAAAAAAWFVRKLGAG